MKSKIVLFTSVFVTAFLLLSAGGVVIAMKGLAQPTAIPTSTSAAQPVQQSGVIQQMANREAEYQKLIAEANQRIETLNNEVTALQVQQTTQPAVSQKISVDQAVQLAAVKAGENEALQSLPDLVNYQGTEAYEVTFTDGKVYVDANSGSILFDGVVPPITTQQAGQIAGKYLGGMNPKYATIKLINLNGTPIYQVTFSGDKEYVVFIDMKGNVLKAQIYQYTGGGGGGGGGGSASTGNSENHDGESGEVD